MGVVDIDKNRGKRIVKLRKKQNLTQDALADATGISRPSMSKIENGGDLYVSTLLNLVSALDTTANQILYEEAGEKMALIEDIDAELNNMDEQDLQKLLAALRGIKNLCKV